MLKARFLFKVVLIVHHLQMPINGAMECKPCAQRAMLSGDLSVLPTKAPPADRVSQKEIFFFSDSHKGIHIGYHQPWNKVRTDTEGRPQGQLISRGFKHQYTDCSAALLSSGTLAEFCIVKAARLATSNLIQILIKPPNTLKSPVNNFGLQTSQHLTVYLQSKLQII